MEKKRIHLDKGNGMFYCGKSIEEGLTIGIREGNQFFSLPFVNQVKAIDICGNCLKTDSPGIYNLIFKKTKSAKLNPIAKTPKAKAKAIQFPTYMCKVTPKLNCIEEIPFNCQLCFHAFSALKTKPIPKKKTELVIEKKHARAIEKSPIEKIANELIDAIIEPTKPIEKKPIAEPSKKAKSAVNSIVKELNTMTPKGKVRQLRQSNKLKVTSAPLTQSKFNKDDKPIELKASQLVDPELIKSVKLNYSLRCIGMHPFSDFWIICHLTNTGKVEIISKSIMNYKAAFAQFNQVIAIAAEKVFKAGKKQSKSAAKISD